MPGPDSMRQEMHELFSLAQEFQIRTYGLVLRMKREYAEAFTPEMDAAMHTILRKSHEAATALEDMQQSIGDSHC